MGAIDLRSDTVTRPTQGMLNAMMQACVGDDVFGEDPTVNRLQAMAAEMFGHEAGLFCPSGTMTNQIAIQVHTRPGDEVICHESSHVYNYEGGGIARNALASTRLVLNNTYTMSPNEVEALIHEPKDWLARTSLVVAEDTSNRGGGCCYTFEALQMLKHSCEAHGLAFHLDGARAFNAIAHQGHHADAYGKLFDSISICLSKGLGAPVGSLLLGNRDFIREARRIRKAMGGGMRQVGYLAAAGIYALEHHTGRLVDDHRRAKVLADELVKLEGIVHVIPPQTNIVIFDVEEPHGANSWVEVLQEEGVLAVPFGKNRLRMVTHLQIDDASLAQAIAGIQRTAARMV